MALLVDFRVILEAFWTLVAAFLWFVDFCRFALPLARKPTFRGFGGTLSAPVIALLRVVLPDRVCY